MAKELTRENYTQGFLIDDECMAGITDEKDASGALRGYSAFVMNTESGEYLGFQTFESLDMALHALKQIPRNWVFESTSGCGGERCGEGKCKGEACKLFNGGKGGHASGGCA